MISYQSLLLSTTVLNDIYIRIYIHIVYSAIATYVWQSINLLFIQVICALQHHGKEVLFYFLDLMRSLPSGQWIQNVTAEARKGKSFL